jgi:hypothetical protein
MIFRKFLIVLSIFAFLGGPIVLTPSLARADGCEVLEKSFGTYGVEIPKVPRYCNVGELIRKVLNIAFALIGSVSLLFLIIGGFRYMASGGNEEQATLGRKTMTYAILGLVVVIMAITLVNIVVNFFLYGHTF